MDCRLRKARRGTPARRWRGCSARTPRPYRPRRSAGYVRSGRPTTTGSAAPSREVASVRDRQSKLPIPSRRADKRRDLHRDPAEQQRPPGRRWPRARRQPCTAVTERTQRSAVDHDSCRRSGRVGSRAKPSPAYTEQSRHSPPPTVPLIDRTRPSSRSFKPRCPLRRCVGQHRGWPLYRQLRPRRTCRRSSTPRAGVPQAARLWSGHRPELTRA